ncbi:colicin-E5 Imm protein [Paraburkholderia sp. BL6665CI2N2]|nr:colicin-E5 Imm protein [Paraburkholderia sp. BL6665CI2N2]
MRLSTDAAIAVCREAAKRGLAISRIEGGIWHHPGFEARVDCIWDSSTISTNMQAAHENNLAAIEFIISEQPEHDTFIITASSVENTE